MSAVGLLLLEDPKARARAEARIRNGQTRRSFFGRSGASQPKGRKPSLPPTIPDVDDEDHPVIVRPSTSLSIPSFSNGKKKSEGASERSTSRNSVFGRKNSVGEMSIRSGTSGSSQKSGAISMSSGITHASAAPERRDRIKEHVTSPQSHIMSGALTGRNNLATVKERDAGPDRARAQPNRMPSDLASETSVDSRPLSPISRNPPSLPPATRISVFDEAMFKDVSRTSPDPDAADKPMPLLQRNGNAFIQATLEHRSRAEIIPQDLTALPGARAIPAESTAPALQTETTSERPSVDDDVKSVPGVEEGINSDLKQDSLLARSESNRRQIDDRLPSGNSSDPSLRSDSTGSSPAPTNPEIRIDYTLHPHDMEQSRSSTSTGKSPALSFASGVRESTVFADSTWEDDIDYIYEQGAEAACDFDWQFDTVGGTPSMHSDGASRYSDASGSLRAHPSSAASDVSRRDSRTLSGVVSTLAERRRASKVGENPRGFSVGHRGFAAARNSGEETRSRKSGPPTPTHLSITAPTKGGSPNPEVGTPLSPFTPNMTQFPVPPTGGRLSDNLSDPESWRNSSKHRKSSSYGSIESSVRTSAATTSTKDTNRWSLASQSSVPSLVPSRPKRTSSVNKGMISSPVNVLPQHPETDDRAFEVEDRPEDSDKAGPPSPEFLLRRPQTSGERLLLQAAGRQRYRPATANGGTVAPRTYKPTTGTSNRDQPQSTKWI